MTHFNDANCEQKFIKKNPIFNYTVHQTVCNIKFQNMSGTYQNKKSFSIRCIRELCNLLTKDIIYHW